MPCKDCKGHVTSAHVDLQIDNNGTWQDAFQFGTPGDTTWTLANQTFEMDVQKTRYDATPLLSLKSTTGTIIIDDIVQRVIHFNVGPATIQSSLNPGTYVYDLVMLSSDATPIRTPLMHGQVIVCQGVTYP